MRWNCSVKLLIMKIWVAKGADIAAINKNIAMPLNVTRIMKGPWSNRKTTVTKSIWQPSKKITGFIQDHS